MGTGSSTLEEVRAALPEDARSRLTSIELAELQVAFEAIATEGSLDAAAMAAALPAGLPWEKLHAAMVAAVADLGKDALPQPDALSYAGLVVGLARTVRARASGREHVRFWRSLYAPDDDGPMGAGPLAALLRGALHASRSGESAASTASETFDAACAEAASLNADEFVAWAADQLPALHAAFEGYVLGALCGLAGGAVAGVGGSSPAREVSATP